MDRQRKGKARSMVILEFTYTRDLDDGVLGARCLCQQGDFGNDAGCPTKLQIKCGSYIKSVTRYYFINMGPSVRELHLALQKEEFAAAVAEEPWRYQ
jgi:hypothetical protein